MKRLLCIAILLNGLAAHAQDAVQEAASGEWDNVPKPEITQEALNPLEEEKAIEGKSVELRGLNKVTARSSVIKGAINEPLEFGQLTIVPRACWIAPSVKRPEQAALLEITEIKPDEGPRTVFSGWMFASSPALSALEHPVYDITMLGCKQ